MLPPAQALVAKASLDAILHSLPTPDQQQWGASLANGHAGFALLLAYAALAKKGFRRQTHEDQARAHLETAVGMLAYYAETPGLFAGYAGVAWTVDHLSKCGLLAEREDLNEEIDEALVAWVAPGTWQGMPELINGLAGIGLYALDRPACARSRLIVDQALETLQGTAESSLSGTAWSEYSDRASIYVPRNDPEGSFNLGVAHGNPGIIGFLAEAWYCGFQRARPLLDTSISWLLSCKSHSTVGSTYGRFAGRDQHTDHDEGRLSWCYGDLGIAAVILMAAARAGQEQWRQEAIRLALACASRPDPWVGVVDAGLCHGAAGIAHLFARIYQGTGIAIFKERAIEFYAGALDMRGDAFESGGFLANTPGLVGGQIRMSMTPDPGLLVGSAGIGLSLLAATTGVEPCWDRHLLAHVPPRRSWRGTRGRA